MKSSKMSVDKTKPARSSGLDLPSKSKQSLSTERLNSTAKCGKNDTSKLDLHPDVDSADGPMDDEFRNTFEKFWKTVADGIDMQQESVPKNTSIGNKFTEMQKRIQMNQSILKNTNSKMKDITFAAERENLSSWKEGLSFRNPSREDLNKFKDVKALDLEMKKLKESKPDKNVFLKNSPGIANFHNSMEDTLNMLDKMKEDDMSDINHRNNINLEFIKTPDTVSTSDEE